MPYCSIEEAWNTGCSPSLSQMSLPNAETQSTPSQTSSVSTTTTQTHPHTGRQVDRYEPSTSGPIQGQSKQRRVEPDYVPEPFPRPERGQMPGYLSAHNMPPSSQLNEYEFAPDMDTLSQYSQHVGSVNRTPNGYNMSSAPYTPLVNRPSVRETFENYTMPKEWRERFENLEKENKRLVQLVEKYSNILLDHTEEPFVPSRRERNRQTTEKLLGNIPNGNGMMDLVMFILLGLLVIFILENVSQVTK
jgi:hypothetical protein